MTNQIEAVQVDGGTLEAGAAANMLTACILSYGDKGLSNLGPLSWSKGTVSVPADPSQVTLKLGHGNEPVLGRAVSFEDTDTGLIATFKIDPTPLGARLLADHAAGRKKAVSVEIDPVIRSESDPTVAAYGVLNAVATVVLGAYGESGFFEADPEAAAAQAVLDQAIADREAAEAAVAAITQTPDLEDSTSESATQETPIPSITKETPVSENTTETDAAETVVPESLTASAAQVMPSQPTITYTAPRGTKHEVLSAMVRRSNGTASVADEKLIDSMRIKQSGPQALYAAVESSPALDIIPFSGSGSPQPYNTAPQYLGELTEAAYGFTSFLQLVGREDLLQPTVTGFHFGNLPTLGTGASSWSSSWAGNAAAVPTSLITTTTSTATAKYFAGGIETPVEWEVFGVQEALLSKYFNRQAQNFGLFMDAGIWAAITGAVSAAEAADPADFTDGIGDAWSMIYDAISRVNSQGGGQATAVVASPAVFDAAMKVSVVNGFAYLSAGTGDVNETSLIGIPVYKDLTGQVADGNVIAGNFREGVTAFTLPGSPLRFQARNITAGGALDTAVVGAGAVLLEQAACFAYVSPFSA